MEAGESEYSVVLKTQNLFIFRDAQNAENAEIAPNWNVSGTRKFQSYDPNGDNLLLPRHLKDSAFT